MTTAVLTPSSTGFDRPHSGGSFLGSLADIWAMTRRNLVHISREPMQLSDVTIQPLLFTVLFVYIFGGAIPIPGGGSYVDFLLAGILALNLTTSTMGTAIGLSTDLHEGMIDRFRTLPMWRSAVLVGRSAADFLTSVLCATIVILTGLAVGWRPGSSAISVIGGFGLLLFFAYAVSWVSACVGTELQEPGVGRLVRFHRLVPADVRVQRVRADPAHAGVAAGRGELEPRERGRGGSPRPLGQSEPLRHGAGLADAAPGRGGADLVGGDPRRGLPVRGALLQEADDGVGRPLRHQAARG